MRCWLVGDFFSSLPKGRVIILSLQGLSLSVISIFCLIKKDHTFMILIKINFQKSEIGANLNILFFNFTVTFRSLFSDCLSSILVL